MQRQDTPKAGADAPTDETAGLLAGALPQLCALIASLTEHKDPYPRMEALPALTPVLEHRDASTSASYVLARSIWSDDTLQSSGDLCLDIDNFGGTAYYAWQIGAVFMQAEQRASRHPGARAASRLLIAASLIAQDLLRCDEAAAATADPKPGIVDTYRSLLTQTVVLDEEGDIDIIADWLRWLRGTPFERAPRRSEILARLLFGPELIPSNTHGEGNTALLIGATYLAALQVLGQEADDIFSLASFVAAQRCQEVAAQKEAQP